MAGVPIIVQKKCSLCEEIVEMTFSPGDYSGVMKYFMDASVICKKHEAEPSYDYDPYGD